MGIQGLLPLLKPIHKETHLSEFSGQTIGVDTYCWLHKGVYGCAMEIVEGKKTNVYLKYVIKRLDMMLYHNVKPYLVFDGGHLPSKANKETERRKSRQDHRAKGLAFLRAGNKNQASECFQKCVDITPEMALEVIKVCREKNIKYIVAPYEADAQLAYLMKTGVTQGTISEDSDLLVYGCNKVIFKMDENGAGTLVDLADLAKLKDLKMHEFTLEKFRHMCILSGCDYLPSIKGVGLKTANKLVQKHSNIQKLLRAIRLENKKPVPTDYEKNFKQADETFLYQLVFDPKTQTLVPLTPLPNTVIPGQLVFAGPMLGKDTSLGIALGNLNPITHEVMDNYDPIVNECNRPVESSIEKSPKCAFSFSKNNTSRQSLTPSSFLDNPQHRDCYKDNNKVTCRRFLLPPLKQSLKKEVESSSEVQDILKMYTTLKHKKSITQNTAKQTHPPSVLTQKKTRMKNPFRALNDTLVTKENPQISSYFKTLNPFGPETNVNKDHAEMIEDDDATGFHELPLPELPEWKHGSTSDEEERKENSPIESSFQDLSSRQDRCPGMAPSDALELTAGQQEVDSLKNPLINLSILTVNKTLNDPRPPKTTSIRTLNKFIYKPKRKDDTVNAKSFPGNDTRTTDSGYLSDTEDNSDPDTLCSSNTMTDKMPLGSTMTALSSSQASVEQNVEKSIQLKSTHTKPRGNGLSRCRSLGISKRKSTPKNTSEDSKIFTYFEYSRTKKPRLES